MDDKGAWRDNRFVERPWKRVTHEEVYGMRTTPGPRLGTS